MNGCVWNHRTRRVGNRAANRPGITALARRINSRERQNYNWNKSENRAASKRHKVPPNDGSQSWLSEAGTSPLRGNRGVLLRLVGFCPSLAQPVKLRRGFVQKTERIAMKKAEKRSGTSPGSRLEGDV